MEYEARLFTPGAADYLAALVGLWEHTYPVRHDALTAEVALAHAQLVMTADEQSLSLRLVGDDPEGVRAARAVVERHLARVAAQREEADRPIDWRETAPPSSAASS